MKLNQKRIREIIEDHEKLGPDKKMSPSRKMTPKETEELYGQAGLQMVSIRLPNDVVDQLKILASADGLKYQPYVRRLLIQHVNKQDPAIQPLTEERVRKLIQEELKKTG